MSEVNEILKKVTASIEEATDKFNARAEDALKEAKKSGKLSEETKAAVDKMASEFNALREAEKTLKAAIGELEQHVAQMPLANAKHIVETVGQQVISAEALKTFSASVEGGKRVSIPVNAALISSGVAEGVVEPQRLPGIDTTPKQRLFIRDLIAPGRTSSPAIFWVQQTGFTNKAAVVAENTTKPYSDIAFATKITPVQAAAVHTLYGYIDYLARNMLPDMCDEDWLYRHARIKRCPRKNAVSAKGFARWDGIAGTPEIPAGTQIQRDDQVTFTTLQTVKASGGLLRVPVIADVAGTAGNTDDGTALRLGTPITGIPSTGYADTLTGGADTEELETWRARVMERYYWIPQGGADPDYVIWAKEIAGITRAWTFRHYKGTGTVGVMVATSNPVNPAPGDELVKAVRDHILPLAPVAGGGLFVFAATEKSIPVTIALAKDTPEIRTAIIAELNALMLRDGAPSGKIYVSRISEAISLATGEVAHQLRVPAADVVLGKTELPVLGNITWATYTGENG